MTIADRLHDAMLAEAERLGLPERFPTDLLHDQRALCTSGVPELFGWVLYRDGTHLVTLPLRCDAGELCETIRRDFDAQHYYLGSPAGIRAVSYAAFRGAIVAESDRSQRRRQT